MKLFNRTGLSYVSCSPFRFPIFKLALAQAALEELGLARGEIDLLVGGKELIFPAPAYQQDLFLPMLAWFSGLILEFGGNSRAQMAAKILDNRLIANNLQGLSSCVGAEFAALEVINT